MLTRLESSVLCWWQTICLSQNSILISRRSQVAKSGNFEFSFLGTRMTLWFTDRKQDISFSSWDWNGLLWSWFSFYNFFFIQFNHYQFIYDGYNGWRVDLIKINNLFCYYFEMIKDEDNEKVEKNKVNWFFLLIFVLLK